MASEQDQQTISIHIKNMVGDLLTIDCKPNESISQIYSIVYESLEEPRPFPSALRLSQYDDEKQDYVPLQTLSDNMMVSLFIEDKEISVTFGFEIDAMVGYPYRYPSPIYMENESFEITTMTISVSNQKYVSFTFAAHFIRSEQDNQLRYTDICYHRDNLCYQISRSEIVNGGWHEMLFTIGEGAVSGRTPADLLLYRYDKDDIVIVAKKVEMEWLRYIAQRMGRSVEEGDALIYPAEKIFLE